MNKKGMMNKGDERSNFLPCNFFPKNRGGQFFLIAAIVIIIVIVSVVTISNYTEKKNEVKLYDLKEQMGIESQQVLDYGTYNNLDSDEMRELMENFIKNYVDYIEEEKNIYFIFGNKQEINALGYQEINPEEVRICINEQTEEGCSVLKMNETRTFSSDDGSINTVVIRIESHEYQFRLKPGENFYFVIWQKSGGEKNVVTLGGEAEVKGTE
jgi:hypothetical protein